MFEDLAKIVRAQIFLEQLQEIMRPRTWFDAHLARLMAWHLVLHYEARVQYSRGDIIDVFFWVRRNGCWTVYADVREWRVPQIAGVRHIVKV